MQNNIALRLVCKELYKTNLPVLLYALHKKYRIPINELFNCINFLLNKNQVIQNEMSIQAQPSFRKWVFNNRAEIFFKKNAQPWKMTDTYHIKFQEVDNVVGNLD